MGAATVRRQLPLVLV